MHQQFLEDETPENERARLDPDHWYENNLCNSSLFANLAPEKIEGMTELVPGRLFTTRMPRDLIEDPSERKDWLDKVKKNNLKVICVLTEPHEFEKYSGREDLIQFYENDCGLTVYNRSIPDFEISSKLLHSFKGLKSSINHVHMNSFHKYIHISKKMSSFTTTF